MPTTRKLQKQPSLSADRIKLPGIHMSPSYQTSSSKQKIATKYSNPMTYSKKMTASLRVTAFPGVAKSTSSHNSNNFESNMVEDDLQFPTIDDLKRDRSPETSAMSKEECKSIKNDENLKEYFAKKFNIDEATAVEGSYNLAFASHRNKKMQGIKLERD